MVRVGPTSASGAALGGEEGRRQVWVAGAGARGLTRKCWGSPPHPMPGVSMPGPCTVQTLSSRYLVNTLATAPTGSSQDAQSSGMKIRGKKGAAQGEMSPVPTPWPQQAPPGAPLPGAGLQVGAWLSQGGAWHNQGLAEAQPPSGPRLHPATQAAAGTCQLESFSLTWPASSFFQVQLRVPAAQGAASPAPWVSHWARGLRWGTFAIRSGSIPGQAVAQFG